MNGRSSARFALALIGIGIFTALPHFFILSVEFIEQSGGCLVDGTPCILFGVDWTYPLFMAIWVSVLVAPCFAAAGAIALLVWLYLLVKHLRRSVPSVASGS